ELRLGSLEPFADTVSGETVAPDDEGQGSEPQRPPDNEACDHGRDVQRREPASRRARGHLQLLSSLPAAEEVAIGRAYGKMPPSDFAHCHKTETGIVFLAIGLAEEATNSDERRLRGGTVSDAVHLGYSSRNQGLPGRIASRFFALARCRDYLSRRRYRRR